MDFEYQSSKDVENIQREQQNSTLPTQPLFEPAQWQCFATHDPPIRQTPPIKPRRSLKVPRTPREQVEPLPKSASGQENKAVVKRLSPALTLGSAGLMEPLSPSLRAQTLLWFERSQLPHLRQPGQRLPCWLHGFATRREAEDLLKDKRQGCFLLRLSESKIGFVLSYRGKDRCRHFIIEQEAGEADGGDGLYLIAGEASRHVTLQELVSYYTQNPVGPFDEMLTTPCDESSGVSERTIELQVQNESGGDAAEATRNACGDHKENDVPSLPEPSASETEPPSPTSSAHTDKDATAEYAVVKKALKKSRSLPRNQRGELIASSSLEVPNLNPQSDISFPGACGGQDSTDVQYAKVNKPPRVVSKTAESPYININIHPDLQGAIAPTTPITRRGSAGDPSSWRLEPLHTYEETPLLGRRQESNEQIDFYAVGRWQDAQPSAGSEHHLYSEVNINRTRESPGHIPPTGRAAPNLPSRPPPSRAIHIQPRPDTAMQRSGEPLLLSSPSRHETSWPTPSELPSTADMGTSIYAQISDMPIASSRPPLPPPNPKKRIL